ncbi:MAG TPA: hypothetical protein EYH22_00220 [Candidatus Nanopusillus sp.]|nr:hypothetical protein [Candidatus Nanopusillus sp.]
MRVMKMNIDGIVHIGLLLHLFEDFVVVSNSVNDKYLKNFDIKIERANADIVGPYILEWEDKIIVSKRSPKDLIECINKYKDVVLVDTKANLLGNLFTIGNNGIIFSKASKKDVETLVNLTGLPAYIVKTEYLTSTLIKIYNNRAMVSQLLSDRILDKIKGILGMEKFDVGSVNFGSPYLKYGIEINRNYLIVGDMTTGHELIKIEEFFTK